MQKIKDFFVYVIACGFALICLTVIYGFATLLSALEIARIIKTTDTRPSTNRRTSLPEEQTTLLLGW